MEVVGTIVFTVQVRVFLQEKNLSNCENTNFWCINLQVIYTRGRHAEIGDLLTWYKCKVDRTCKFFLKFEKEI